MSCNHCGYGSGTGEEVEIVLFLEDEMGSLYSICKECQEEDLTLGVGELRTIDEKTYRRKYLKMAVLYAASCLELDLEEIKDLLSLVVNEILTEEVHAA
jgi:hypothetical protein